MNYLESSDISMNHKRYYYYFAITIVDDADITAVIALTYCFLYE